MENKMSIAELTLRSEEIRKRLLEVVYKAKAGHIGDSALFAHNER